jgi:hypothetical protein
MYNLKVIYGMECVYYEEYKNTEDIKIYVHTDDE